jgi:hypothetical protein
MMTLLQVHVVPWLLLWILVIVAGELTTSSSSSRNNNIRGGSYKDNMNGEYHLSSTPNATNTQWLFPRYYREYPDLPTESFDVYSPLISHLYSQVFYKGLPPVKLPDDIVSKYDTKVMAVVGFELDQVRVDSHGNERSVPMNAVYNHHFEATMLGGGNNAAAAHFELVNPNDERLAQQRMHMGHGIPPNQPYWLVVDNNNNNELQADATTVIPTRQDFGGANGGEVRQSFHGYAPGFAQLLQSPKEIQITPMQIDTWHRDEMDLDLDSTRFVAGPLPRSSLAPKINATYSGLLECPVSTRIHKHLPPQGFFPLAQGTCSKDGSITTSDDCLKAVTELVRETDSKTRIQQSEGNDPNRPKGCSARAITTTNLVNVDEQEAGQEEERVVEAYYNNASSSSSPIVNCGSSTNSNLFSATATSLVAVSVMIDTAHDLVTIQLTGPAHVWFGVGFGAHMMKDLPWTIIVEGGEDGIITERHLADHSSGTLVTPTTVHVQSKHITGQMKTVVLTRPIQGPLFTFETAGVTEIRFINAIGSSEQFSYHENKEASSMLVLPVVTPADGPSSSGICLCQQDPPPFGAATGGSLEYIPVTGQRGERGVPGKVQLDNKCQAYPRMDLLEQKNPTCDIRTYVGGQNACHHMWSLLDADQDIPWPDQPLEYRLKFRFWVQPYDAKYHTNVQRTTWGIGSPVEYDVPQCAEGIPGCSQEGDGDMKRWVHTIRGTFSAGNSGKLVAAHFHCHAPTCLSTALYLCNDDNKQDEGCDETTGTLLCQENAVAKHGEPGERFNEPGFIYQPPCLWGSPDYGLEPPVDVRGRTLFAKKTADATYGHHGEMAWLQMYYV